MSGGTGHFVLVKRKGPSPGIPPGLPELRGSEGGSDSPRACKEDSESGLEPPFRVPPFRRNVSTRSLSLLVGDLRVTVLRQGQLSNHTAKGRI